MTDRGAALSELASAFDNQLSVAQAVRQQHSSGEGIAAATLPDAVFFAQSTEDVAAAVKICARHRLPIVPFGVGTSLEGHVDAIDGGLTISLARLDRVLAVNQSDFDVHVEAGVTREALNRDLRDMGLFFPLDPGANATLGGMAATRASGTNAVRYGTMREVTLGLTVVTPQGEIITTGGRARKSSTGYDLTGLYIGSEGTLGIITELYLRVFGMPEVIAAGVAQFNATEPAIEAVIAVLQYGISVARLEFLDALQMQACITFSRLDGFDPKPTLFLELHGSPASVADQRQQIEDTIAGFGAPPPRWAERQEERTALWTARHNAYWAARALQPGSETITTDACVPISELPRVIAETQAEAEKSGLQCPIVGHVGDGNFHVMVLHHPHQRDTADRLATSIARRAIACGGTASGEHGIGHYRIPLLVEEHGVVVARMQAIKSALDPLGIMNPGKMLPSAVQH